MSTPLYGVTPETRKPLTQACTDLWVAIRGLQAHHDAQEAAFHEISAPWREQVARSPGLAEALGAMVAMYTDDTFRLAKRRKSLLDRLGPFKAYLTALVIEADALAGLETKLDYGAVRPAEFPRVPPSEDLQFADALRLIVDGFARDARRTNALILRVAGPVYLLQRVGGAPTDHSKKLHEALDMVAAELSHQKT